MSPKRGITGVIWTKCPKCGEGEVHVMNCISARRYDCFELMCEACSYNFISTDAPSKICTICSRSLTCLGSHIVNGNI